MDIIVKRRRGGFTLAEVLITLSIIGVVAALTIPSLVVKNQEKERIVQLKKAYNVISNAYSLAKVQYGEPSGWSSGSDSKSISIDVMDKITPFLNVLKRCDGASTHGCFDPNITHKTILGTNEYSWGQLDFSKAVLADSTVFWIYPRNSDCSGSFGSVESLQGGCGSIIVDINGQKNPNQISKDAFAFWYTKNGIVPSGIKGDGWNPLNGDCKSGPYGYGCTAWAILKENMNYPADWD